MNWKHCHALNLGRVTSAQFSGLSFSQNFCKSITVFMPCFIRIFCQCSESPISESNLLLFLSVEWRCLGRSNDQCLQNSSTLPDCARKILGSFSLADSLKGVAFPCSFVSGDSWNSISFLLLLHRRFTINQFLMRLFSYAFIHVLSSLSVLVSSLFTVCWELPTRPRHSDYLDVFFLFSHELHGFIWSGVKVFHNLNVANLML